MPAKMIFEQNIEALDRMLPEERDAKIAELTKMCICGACPTYIGTGETVLMFCETGRSKIIEKGNGCICPGCPVQKSLAQRWNYYCLKGSAKEQAGLL